MQFNTFEDCNIDKEISGDSTQDRKVGLKTPHKQNQNQCKGWSEYHISEKKFNSTKWKKTFISYTNY